MVSDTEPLLQLLRQLEQRHYEFVTVTPATHARVLRRRRDDDPTLRDIFGWNQPFMPTQLDPELLSVLEAANALEQYEGQLRSTVRVASLGGSLFLHSSFPTERSDSIFFGPDTYRFLRFVEQQLTRVNAPQWIVDMGAGSGAAGIVVAKRYGPTRATLIDVNPAALRFAQINAAFAGVDVETISSHTIPHGPDLVIANPPYMMDANKRTYRDGGDLLGGAVALDWARQALAALHAGGTMLLYSGAAYQRGRAPLIDGLGCACESAGAALIIDELDPDVFGEELDNAAYAQVERIAAVGAVITKAAADL